MKLRAAFFMSLVPLLVGVANVRDAAGDQITVFCSNGLQAVLEDLRPKFERATKHTVVVTYGLAAVLKQRLEAGEAFDVAFLTPAAIDDLIARGKIAAGTRTQIARSGLAIALRAGAPKSDISTVDAFKRALLDATSIAYVKEGASGVAFAALIQRLGIAGDLKAKTRLTATGEEVSAAVVKGDVQFGVLPMSEILPVKGAAVLGQFPSDLQSYIVMVGGVSAASAHAAAGRELIAYLTAPAALPVIKAKGMEK
ncbi:MAG TPA: extracellular solute-binding protein [Vicinamibacterales bacterium]|jgi:molybdate transport system substrate-binding protein|nr:extracellular solute-binding protein [Vicinamibacterales bacterium]